MKNGKQLTGSILQIGGNTREMNCMGLFPEKKIKNAHIRLPGENYGHLENSLQIHTSMVMKILWGKTSHVQSS